VLAGSDAERLRSQGFPGSIGVFDYGPHSVVMPRASTNVHQGGVGTTGQAMRAGRPMLVVPFGQDQPDNARRCVDLGIARTVSRRAYASSVRRELSRLLSDPSYAARASEVGAIVGAEDGIGTACAAIEEALSVQGSRFKVQGSRFKVLSD
jgi:UDP:flavonoid glycosyltransferase YjiC (YdhE family)